MKSRSIGQVATENPNRDRVKCDLSHDTNTSANFGYVQPIESRIYMPHSHYSINTKSLSRSAVMKVSPFARIKERFIARKVNFEDLWHPFKAMLTEGMFTYGSKTFVPKHVPTIEHRLLSTIIFAGAKVQVYPLRNPDDTGDNVTPWYTEMTTRDPDSLLNQSYITVDSVDMIFHGNGTTAKDYKDLMNTILFTSSQYPLPSAEPYERTNEIVWSEVFGAESGTIDWSQKTHNESDVWGLVTSATGAQNEVELTEADYIIKGKHKCTGTGCSGNTMLYVIAVKLSDWGKRNASFLRGLGIKPNFQSTKQVSLLPILAWNKACFDEYGLTQFINWETTYTHRLIDLLSSEPAFEFGFSNLNSFVSDATLRGTIKRTMMLMFQEFNQFAWMTEDVDYISSHTQYDGIGDGIVFNEANNRDGSGFDRFITKALNSTSSNETFRLFEVGRTNNGSLDSERIKEGNEFGQKMKSDFVKGGTLAPSLKVTNEGTADIVITAEQIKAVEKLTRAFNMSTLAGQDIARRLKAFGLGDYFGDNSDCFGYREVDFNISEITATSDTYQATTNEGFNLGQSAGKGLTYDKGETWKFDSGEDFGIYIIMYGIAPQSGYCQGMSPTLFANKPLDFYNPMWDGMGKKVDDSSIVLVERATNQFNKSLAEYQSFGWHPTYSEWKSVVGNIVNGDFALFSQRDNFAPYHNDKIISGFDYEALKWALSGQKTVEGGSTTCRVCAAQSVKYGDTDNLPLSGNAWRYLCRWKFMSNLRRMFYNYSNNLDNHYNSYYNTLGRYVGLDSVGASQLDEFLSHTNESDDFLIHFIVNVDAYQPVKPYATCWGTLEDDNHDGISKITHA